MNRRRVIQIATLLAAAVIGSVATIALLGGKQSSGQVAPQPVATATVVRTNLTTSVLTEGTLGYEPTSPVVNQMSGTYTSVPAPGTTIEAGQTLYRVDNQPVVLMSGTTPAWRTFAAGMPNGPDVAELEANLITLGYARGLFSVAGERFSSLTAAAISRWQVGNGYPSTGQLSLGEVIFESGPVLVGATDVAPGQAAAPGDQPYQVTTTTRIVSVPLSASLPPVSLGETVSIVLASGATTPGRVSAVAPAFTGGTGSGASNSQSTSNGSSGTSGSSDSAASSASTVATVTPNDPAATGTGSGTAVQVSLTSQSVANVLAVPIPALLALAGGGYGLEVITPSGHHELVGVTTGTFTGSQVQVFGPGIKAGVKVAVAQ
jgi:hypothetical protein